MFGCCTARQTNVTSTTAVSVITPQLGCNKVCSENETRQVKHAVVTASQVKHTVWASKAAVDTVVSARSAISNVLDGKDDRVIAIVGPCSIHDPDAAIVYAKKLIKVAEQHAGDLVVVMRVYFEKPRTTVGWKGLINDPDLDGSCDIQKGLEKARRLLVAINEMGMPAATEFLDMITPNYIADMVSWGAIGARTTESQTESHRKPDRNSPKAGTKATRSRTENNGKLPKTIENHRKSPKAIESRTEIHRKPYRMPD